jgi:hypothetical protein
MIFQKISQNKLKRKRSRETAMEVKRPVLEDEGRTIFNFKARKNRFCMGEAKWTFSVTKAW